MKKRVDLTIRDIQLIKDLYEMRVLSAKQVKRAYYDNKWYGYRRVKELEEAGYLESRPLVKGRKKETQMYYLTNKSIEMLEIDKKRQANKNRIVIPELASRQMTINEVYITMKQLQQENGINDVWEWKESRTVKEEYKFSRRDLISGVLINKVSGEKYGIYIPTSISKIETLCNSYQKEIDKHDHIRENIILCPDNESNKEIMRYFNDNMGAVGLSLRVLPYPTGINIIFNTLTNKDEYLKSLFKEQFGVQPEEIKKTPQLYAMYESENSYYAELLTNDTVIKRHIKFYATDMKDRKPLRVVCWSFQVHELGKFFSYGKEKILLTQLQFSARDESQKGIENKEIYRNTRINKPAQDEKMIMTTIKLPSTICEFFNNTKIKGVTSRSDFIVDLIKQTDEYKNFMEVLKNG